MKGAWKVQYSQLGSKIGQEELEAIAKTLKQDVLSGGGPTYQEFSRKFSRYMGVKYALPVSSATSALYLSAQVLGLKKGDEVITTPMTFWATTRPLLARKVKVRFGDIDSNTLNLSPKSIKPLINKKTKAIYVVHFGGQAVDMDPIMRLAKKHKLCVVEDVAHAPGAEYKGRKLGSIGDIGCFSFHSLKNITTGEGGMFTTNNEKIYKNARSLSFVGLMGEKKKRKNKTIGGMKKPDHEDCHAVDTYEMDYVGDVEPGLNFRLSEVQCAMGIVQLKKLAQLNKTRIRIGRYLNKHLSRIDGIVVQNETPGVSHVYHLYTFFFDEQKIGASKDDFIKILQEEKRIQIILRYFPIHLLGEYRQLGHKFGECPVAERVFFEQMVNLPIYPSLTQEQVNYMAKAVRSAVEKVRAK